MANGNGPFFSGTARTHFNNGDITDALRAADEQYKRERVQKIIGDPRLLIQQPLAWVKAQIEAYPKLEEMWETRVREFAKSADGMLQKYLQDCPGADLSIQPCLQFTGRGIIFLSTCPLCKAHCVELQIVPIEKFEAPSVTKRLFKNQKCNHFLPLPEEFWQFLCNINYLASKTVSTSSDPSPES